MTKIEQINWARQILSQTPIVPERDDETVKYLTEANLRLREALEAMTSKRDEATERAHRHLATATNWRHKAVKFESELDAYIRVDSGLVQQIDELEKEVGRLGRLMTMKNEQIYDLQQRGDRLDTMRNDEVKRLKQRVNELIRAKKVTV